MKISRNDFAMQNTGIDYTCALWYQRFTHGVCKAQTVFVEYLFMHKTLIVADTLNLFTKTALEVISFDDYLANYPKKDEPKTRVINLCDTQKYLSRGYYCSLLAQARKHPVLPSLKTINDLSLQDSAAVAARLSLPPWFVWPADKILPAEIYVLFGQAKDQQFEKLAEYAFRHFPAPVLKIRVVLAQVNAPADSHATIGVMECQSCGFDLVPADLQEWALSTLQKFTSVQWRAQPAAKRARWDMAILTDPTEPNAPSDSKALKHFVKAAASVGIHAQIVSALRPDEVAQYDALFIRQTTAIDHTTYRLARSAEREGLVVIDDTQSILRCCNKVFLHDAFTYQNVPAPKSRLVADASSETCAGLVRELGLPLVLKLPESAFSLGVYKVEDAHSLEQKLTHMLEASALVLIQEYVYTDFDWRIGMLGGKPIYACKYFMARNHWQIYNHQEGAADSGDFVTMPTFEVPKPVLQAATKAARVVGEGLYGVDIKQAGDKVYVIEVNDNPSIDSGIEDAYLGKALYELIMQEFADRLEQRGRR